MNPYPQDDPVANLLRGDPDSDVPEISRDPIAHLNEDYQLVVPQHQHRYGANAVAPLAPLSEAPFNDNTDQSLTHLTPAIPGSGNGNGNGNGLLNGGGSDSARVNVHTNNSNHSNHNNVHGNAANNVANNIPNNVYSVIQGPGLGNKSSNASGLTNDNDPLASKRRPKRDPPPKPALKTARPAFVMKIWLMVNDPDNSRYIRWSDDGKLFHVFHREDFMKNILPKYFKHNNFASFVRQLNMYGWHKVQDINTGSLYLQIRGENQGVDEAWQFENEYFQRDREDLLDKIVRHKSGTGGEQGHDANAPGSVSAANGDHNGATSSMWTLLMSEMEQIKRNQITISEDLRRIRKDNKTLWQENYIARERHQKQAQTLDKILTFLATVYSNNGKIGPATTNVLASMFPDGSGGELIPWAVPNQQSQPLPQVHTVEPLPYLPQLPYLRPRLMLMNLAYQNNGSPNQNQNQNQGGGGGSSSPGLNTITSGNFNGGNMYNHLPEAGASISGPNDVINPGQGPISGPGQGQAGSPDPSSVEDIIRSYNSPSGGSNMTPNRYYQLLMDNSGTTPMLPRHYFPEITRMSSHSDIGNVEQNIKNQGNTILQVQDWILKLQQQQQQQQQGQKDAPTPSNIGSPSFDVNSLDPATGSASGPVQDSVQDPDTAVLGSVFDEPDSFFNVNDFLKDSNTPIESSNPDKRNIEEVQEDEVAGPPKKRRT